MRSFLYRSFFLSFLLAGALRAQSLPPDLFAQGLSLFQQGQYDQAITVLGQALQDDPKNAKAHYYLGYSHLKKGDRKEAALEFYRVDQNKPSPDIKAFADKLCSGLSLEDRDWVEKQREPVAEPPAGVRGPGTPGKVKVPWGIRASTGLVVPNLGDLYEHADSLRAIGNTYQLSDPTYQLQNSVPWNVPYFSVDPFLSLDRIEIGGKFTYYMPTSADYTEWDSYGYSVSFTGSIDGFSIANVDRFYFPMDPGSRFILEPTLGIVKTHFQYNISRRKTAGTPPNDDYGFDVSGIGLDLGLKAGFSFQVGQGLDLSVLGGYEVSRIDDLHGTYYDAAYPSMNGTPGRAVMAFDSYYNRNLIWFLPDDPSKDGFFYGGSSQPQNTRPLSLDLSGIRLDMDLSYSF